MRGRSWRAGFALIAAVLALTAFGQSAAHATEQDRQSEGVRITVVIEPLDCATGCGGGLASTGWEVPVVVIWLACALLVAGLVLLLRRGHGRAVLRASTASTTYDVEMGQRTDRAGAEPSYPPDVSLSRGSDSGGRDIERGERQCPNT